MWPQSASEQYRPSDRRLSAKLVQTFEDSRCRVACVTDPYGSVLGFLDRIQSLHYLSSAYSVIPRHLLFSPYSIIRHFVYSAYSSIRRHWLSPYSIIIHPLLSLIFNH
jgi:hypothetical protein